MDGLLRHIATLAQSPHVAELQAPLASVAAQNRKRTAASMAPLQVQMKRLRTQQRAEAVVTELVQDLLEGVLANVSHSPGMAVFRHGNGHAHGGEEIVS